MLLPAPTTVKVYVVAYLIAIAVHQPKHGKLAIICITDNLDSPNMLIPCSQTSWKARTQTLTKMKLL